MPSSQLDPTGKPLAGEIIEERYCYVNPISHETEWVEKPSEADVFGFWSAMSLVKRLNKINTNSEYKFSMTTASDVSFMEYVRNGEPSQSCRDNEVRHRNPVL